MVGFETADLWNWKQPLYQQSHNQPLPSTRNIQRRLTGPSSAHRHDDQEEEEREASEDDGDVAASIVEAKFSRVNFHDVALLSLDGRWKLHVVTPEVVVAIRKRKLVGGRARVHHHHHGRLVLAVGRVVPVHHVVFRAVFVYAVKRTATKLLLHRGFADPDEELSVGADHGVAVLMLMLMHELVLMLMVHRKGCLKCSEFLQITFPSITYLFKMAFKAKSGNRQGIA